MSEGRKQQSSAMEEAERTRLAGMLRHAREVMARPLPGEPPRMAGPACPPPVEVTVASQRMTVRRYARIAIAVVVGVTLTVILVSALGHR